MKIASACMAAGALLLSLSAFSCSSSDSSDPNDDTGVLPSDRHPIGKADMSGSCAGGDYCGGQSDGTCWCDDLCADIGDCCDDRDAVCGAEACTATFQWLQKDAYKSEAGRSAPFWPPHTTTVMTVTCGGQVVSEAIMKNHGTAPDAVDAAGTPILVEVKSEQATGDRASLEALANGLRDCECGTEFLSLDALAAPDVQELLAELTAYMEANLTCPFEGGVGVLIQALNDKDVTAFLDKAGECSWTSGASWSEGLDEALGYFAEESFMKLSDYHVCNNDAMIQAEMWEKFVSTGTVPSCDTASSMCAGPKWFYNP